MKSEIDKISEEMNVHPETVIDIKLRYSEKENE